jgi:hypothetical protein
MIDLKAVERSGAEYRGIQEGIPGKLSGIVIIQDLVSGTSIGVPLDKWSQEQLDKQLDAARKRMSA